jgi:hypothetical protein
VYACGRGSERCAYGVIQIVGASRRWEESSLKGRLKPESATPHFCPVDSFQL